MSTATARKLVCMLARHGNNVGVHATFSTDAQIRRFFEANGYDFERLVEEARVFKSHIPLVENILGPEWHSVGGKVSKVDLASGQETLLVDGDGTYSNAGYWSQYEVARDALDRSVEKMSFSEFQTACVAGVSSIEGYVRHRVDIWNASNPGSMLLDSKSQKVSFDDKIAVWLPKMAGGRRLDRSGKIWSAFLDIRAIRDVVAIHPKAGAIGIGLQDLAQAINRFKEGIPGLLIDLHFLFGERIPARIIRGFFAPLVEVARD